LKILNNHVIESTVAYIQLQRFRLFCVYFCNKMSLF